MGYVSIGNALGLTAITSSNSCRKGEEIMSSVQSQIQQDWNNREFVETITSSIKKISEFLNAFDLSARSRLAMLNQKLTNLERQVDYIEARVNKT